MRGCRYLCLVISIAGGLDSEFVKPLVGNSQDCNVSPFPLQFHASIHCPLRHCQMVPRPVRLSRQLQNWLTILDCKTSYHAISWTCLPSAGSGGAHKLDLGVLGGDGMSKQGRALLMSCLPTETNVCPENSHYIFMVRQQPMKKKICGLCLKFNMRPTGVQILSTYVFRDISTCMRKADLQVVVLLLIIGCAF